MRRSQLKRRTPLKRSGKPLKRVKLRSRRKQSSKSRIQLLKDKLEKVQRLTVIRRDKHCVLRDIYPHICDPVLQADHLISRSFKSIFFDLQNLNCICSNMNRQKGKHWPGWETIQRLLEAITEERYGKGTVQMLEERKRFLKTWAMDELEGLIDDYEKMYR